MIVRFLNLETSNHKVMTTLHFFKNSMVLAFLLFVSAFTFTACGDNAKKTDTEEVAEDQNKPNSDLTKESDERFLVRATEINMEEIELGKLAQQKGTHADVKALGKMMEDGHTKALNDLKTLAASKSIAVPAASTQDAINAYNKLNEKSGDEFDREYCDMMVKGHKDAISLFENATQGNNDPDVKTWASNMLPDLRMHLQHAEACEAKLKQLSEKTN